MHKLKLEEMEHEEKLMRERAGKVAELQVSSYRLKNPCTDGTRIGFIYRYLYSHIPKHVTEVYMKKKGRGCVYPQYVQITY